MVSKKKLQAGAKLFQSLNNSFTDWWLYGEELIGLKLQVRR